MNEKTIANTVVLLADDGMHLLQSVGYMIEKKITVRFHYFFKFRFNGVEKRASAKYGYGAYGYYNYEYKSDSV